jgi:hypothetical protein
MWAEAQQQMGAAPLAACVTMQAAPTVAHMGALPHTTRARHTHRQTQEPDGSHAMQAMSA